MKVNRIKILRFVLGSLLLVGQANAYEIYSEKKGVGSGNLGRIEALNSSWYYNWNIRRVTGVDEAIEYVPMKHNKFWRNESELANIGEFNYFLGFNEPESSDQGDISVSQAINQWPNLEAAVAEYGNPGAQMGSPATVNPDVPWIIDFMTQAEEKGLKVDFMAMHKYPTPVNSGSILNGAQWYHDTYQKDVWITEFNAADWSAPNNYTHEQSYTWMAEVLFRLESTPYIKRYAIFPWSGKSSQSEASGIFVVDEQGNTTYDLTPLGKLYAEYRSDDIEGPYEQTWYHLHNRGSRMRLHDNDGTPSMADIFSEGAPAEFELVWAGSVNYYIVNQGTGKRLGSNGTNTYWTDSETGTSVQWNLTTDTYNWIFISHAQSGKYLYGQNTGNIGLGTLGSGDTYKWTFVRTGTPYGLIGNDAPTFINDPVITPNGKVGVAYSGTLAGNARDGDSDQLSYGKVSGPGWLMIAPDGTLSGSPGSANVGLNIWTVAVTDDIAGTDTATLEITVYAAGWKGFPVEENGFSDTGSFIGWTWVGDQNSPSDWVWNVNLKNWLYIPIDSQLNMTGGGWYYLLP